MAITVSVAPVIGTDNSSTAFVTVTIGGCTIGNALIGCVLWNINATNIATVTATGETNGTLIGTHPAVVGTNGSESAQLFYFPNLAAGGTKTVTANFSGTNPDAVIVVMEIAGANALSLPDPSISWHQEVNGTTPTSSPGGSVTTNTAGCILFGATMGGSFASPTVPTGWTNIAGVDAAAVGNSMPHAAAGYLLNAGAAGAKNFNWTLGASDQYPLVTAAFQLPQLIGVAQETQSTGGSGTSITTAFGTPVRTGSSIHVVVRGVTASSYTVSDNLNGAYTQRGATLNDGAAQHVLAHFTVDNAIAGATTITVTPNVSATFVNVWAREIYNTTGFDTHAEQIQAGLANTATDAVTTGVAAPGNQPGLLSAFTNSTVGSALPSAGTGFTSGGNPWGTTTLSEWLRYTAFSPRAGTWTASSINSTNFFNFGAFFKEIGATAGGGTFTLACNTATYTLSANAATLTSTSGAFTLPLATATYTLTGITANLALQGSFTLLANPASYDVLGGISLSDFTLDSLTALYTLSGQVVSFSLNGGSSFSLSLGTAIYSYTANATILTQSLAFALSLDASFYNLSGQANNFAIGGGGVTPPPSPTAILNLEIVSDAFQKIGVIDEAQAPTAEQGANGLRILNDYLLWQARDGMRLGWYTQTDLSAVAPIRAEDVWAVKTLLASQLAIAYGITITDPLLAKSIGDAERTLSKRTLRYMESDLSELSRAQGSAFGGPGWN